MARLVRSCFIKNAPRFARRSKKLLLEELRVARSKLLQSGGKKIKAYLRDEHELDSFIDMDKLKDKPLFVAADELYSSLNEWLERIGEGQTTTTTWEDMWSLTQMANSVREFAATIEELPLGLAGGMEKLRERMTAMQSEVDGNKDSEAKAAEMAEAVARSQSIEAIQELRAQVLHLKNKAEEGEGFRKEMDAEGEIFRREAAKSAEAFKILKANGLRDKVVSEEEIATLRRELVKLRKQTWESTSQLREKYDSALTDMEKTTNAYSDSAGGEVNRLEGLLAEANEKLRSVRQVGFLMAQNAVGDGDSNSKNNSNNKNNNNNNNNNKNNNNNNNTYNENVFDLETEISTLRSHLDEANSEAKSNALNAKKVAEDNANLEISHSEQVGTLREQFGHYREAQDKLVKGLNGQIRGLKEKAGGGLPFSRTREREKGPKFSGIKHGLDRKGGGGRLGGGGANSPPLSLEEKINRQQLKTVGSAEIEELMSLLAQREAQLNSSESKLKRLLYEYKIKVEEAEAASSSAYSVGGGNGRDEATIRAVDNAILKAKHAVAEQEIELLRSELRKSADGASDMRREVAARVLQTAQARRSSAASPKVESILKQLGDTKRLANAEITRLKTQISTFKESKSDAEDVLAMKKKIANMHSALSLAKEDLSRKTKIVMNLRVSRASDESAVAQWKAEVSSLDAKLVKCSRELQRKETLYKECKEKLENVGVGGGEKLSEENNENSNPANNDNNNNNNDNDNNDDVQNKLRGFHLERTRMRQQVAVLKSKVDAQYEEITRLQTESEQLKTYESKMNLLKQSIARKDSILKGVKAQLEATAKEFVAFKNSSESALFAAERKLKVVTSKMKEERSANDESDEKESVRVGVLEENKVQLTDELQGIKSSLYNILGDLYDANVKARENINSNMGGGGSGSGSGSGGGGGDGGDESVANFSLGLDQASVDKIGTMLDLTPTEMNDIFKADNGGGVGVGAGVWVGGGGGGGGGGGIGEAKAAFLSRVNQALNDKSGSGETVTGLAANMIATQLSMVGSTPPSNKKSAAALAEERENQQEDHGIFNIASDLSSIMSGIK